MAITIIAGDPGAGKTAFATNIAVNKMNNSLEDYVRLKREIKYLKEGGFNYIDIPPQKHIVYADYDIKFGKKRAYTIDGFKIGLPNPYFDTTFIPPYATIFLDEAQRYYDSRNNKALRNAVYNWYQLHRHNNYNVYLICQRPANIDLNIRGIAEKIYIIENLYTKADEYGRTVYFKWQYKEFTSSEAAEDYCVKKDKKEYSDMGVYGEVVSKLPIFNFYKSHSNKPLFYNGRENSKFDYSSENSTTLNVESFNEYNSIHHYDAPRGYWKSADYDKAINKKLQGG